MLDLQGALQLQRSLLNSAPAYCIRLFPKTTPLRHLYTALLSLYVYGIIRMIWRLTGTPHRHTSIYRPTHFWADWSHPFI